MKPVDSVTVTVQVDADPAAAFAVFTDEVDAWWRRGPVYRFRTRGHGAMRFEPGVGGRLIEVYGESPDDVYEVGEIRVWEPGRRLVFEFRGTNFAPGESTEVEVRFEANDDGTEVSVEHRGWEGFRPDHPVRHGTAEIEFVQMRGSWWIEQLRSLRGRLR